jgi:hypothetical protein
MKRECPTCKADRKKEVLRKKRVAERNRIDPPINKPLFTNLKEVPR